MPSRQDLAIAALNGGRLDLAERLIRDQLAATPRDWDAHRILAACLCERKDYVNALAEADEAILLKPDSWLTHFERGKILRRLGRLSEAETAIREAIALKPNAARPFSELAYLLAKNRGDREGAIRAARAGLAIDPRHLDSLGSLASALLLTHRTEEANEVFRRAMALAPHSAVSHTNLGLSLLHRGDYAAGRAELEEALRLDPQKFEGQASLGWAEWLARVRGRPPYELRFATQWAHSTRRWRAALILVPMLVGIAWPGAWAALAYPLGVGVAHLRRVRYPRTSASSRLTARLIWVTVVALALGFLLIRSSVAAQTLGSPPSAEPIRTFIAELPGYVIGAMLPWTAIPAFVTRDRARAVAIAVVGSACLAALLSTLVSEVAWVATLAVFFLAVFAGRLVFRIERSDRPAAE